MKLSKVLLGSAIALSLVFGFASCTSDDDDDDDNNMISGSGNNYSIDYDNTNSGDISRGYDTTLQNHLGSICQITFNKSTVDETTGSGNGAMAYIWDLQSDVAAGDSRAAKELRRFCIAGVRLVKDGSDLKADPYVSYYTDVVDIQADNFGEDVALKPTIGEKAKTGDSYTANENTKFDLGDRLTKVTPDGEGAVTITVKVEPVDDNENYSKDAATRFKVDFYNGAYTEDQIKALADDSTEIIASTEITATELGYTASTDGNTYLKQQTAAVYANVYGGKKLSGTWKYIHDYANADVVEE